jgi:hypothetical protein
MITPPVTAPYVHSGLDVGREAAPEQYLANVVALMSEQVASEEPVAGLSMDSTIPNFSTSPG